MYTPPISTSCDFNFTDTYTAPVSTSCDFNFGVGSGTGGGPSGRRKFLMGAS